MLAVDLSKNIKSVPFLFLAGDNVKFGFPMAWSITTVAWSVIEFREAYIQAGLYERVLEMIQWGTDYFMKAHPEDNVFYVQVISLLLHIHLFF